MVAKPWDIRSHTLIGFSRYKMVNIEKQSVELSFFTRFNLKSWGLAQELLKTIFQMGDMFAPDWIDINGSWAKMNTITVDTLAKRWSKFNNVLMKRERKYESELAILLGDMGSGLSILSLWIEESFFTPGTNIHNFLDFSLSLYGLLLPEYGFIHTVRDKIDMATVNDPDFGKMLLPVNLAKGLPGIFWANFFGTKYVELIGKEKFLNAQSHKKQELINDGFLLITTPSPLDVANVGCRNKQEELKKYIGLQYFYPNLAKNDSLPSQ
jgi:hypothetical protein